MFYNKNKILFADSYFGKASFVLSLTASMKIIPSKTACLTFDPKSKFGKSKQRSISSRKIRSIKGSLLSTQGFVFH